MHTVSLAKKVLLFFLVVLFVSCDKDFNSIGADIVGDDHFDSDLYVAQNISAYSKATFPVQSNNLTTNPLGVYDNPVFGKTTASFVSQVQLNSVAPTFDASAVITKVELLVPYFSTLKSTETDGSKIYELDSLYGTSKIKLEVFESGYFLRDFDPAATTQTTQLYYSDMNSTIDAAKIGARLNDTIAASQNDDFVFSAAENVVTAADGTVTRSKPGMKLQLNKAFFTQKIINTASGNLLNNSVFKNYFRGLYFKVGQSSTEPNGNSLSMLNFGDGKITVTYTELTPSTTDDPTATVEKTVVLNLKGNTISLLDNEYNSAYQNAIANPNTSLGADRLYLKGGAGSTAFIDLFNGADDNNDGVSNELADLRTRGWLINEANLVFYIDRTTMDAQAGNTNAAKAHEPRRVYLFDAKNNRPLIDYYYDNTTISTDAKLNKYVFGGIMEVTSDGKGEKYKIRITEHIKALLKLDSTNVRLGLSVTENINTITNAALKTPLSLPGGSSNFKYVPVGSVISPLGTVLYGNNTSPADEPKKLKLEIYYTKPN